MYVCVLTCVRVHVCVCVGMFYACGGLGYLSRPLSNLFSEAGSLVEPGACRLWLIQMARLIQRSHVPASQVLGL